MFKIEITKDLDIKRIIDAISSMFMDAILNVSSEGLRFQSMDPSHVAFIDLFLHPDSFAVFEVTEEQQIKINLTHIRSILKRKVGHSSLVIKSGDGKIIFKFKTEGKRSTATLSSKLLVIYKEEMGEPKTLDIEPDIKFIIKSDEIRKIPNVFKDFDYIYVSVKNGVVEFTADDDSGESIVTLDVQDEFFVEMPPNGSEAKSYYNTSYLEDVLKWAALSENTEVKFDTEEPILFKFDLGNGSEVTTLIAPRIDQGEDGLTEDDVTAPISKSSPSSPNDIEDDFYF
jgi:proliferating cell nuclear antigen PCNA